MSHPLVVDCFRPAAAAVISYLVARRFALPEAYWAAVTTVVVTQSAPGTSGAVAGRRFLGTAMGAILGAVLAVVFPLGIWLVGLGIFLLGLICLALGRINERLRTAFDRTTHRFAGITLVIILLIPHFVAPWIAALHRFFEVSIGIIVALVLTILWPDRPGESPKP
jgi:uncharacterized membrane protein YccC